MKQKYIKWAVIAVIVVALWKFVLPSVTGAFDKGE